MGAFDGEIPLVPKVTLKPLLSVLGHNRDKERAVVDLLPDPLIPRVAAAQLALIEENLDTGGAKRLGNPLGNLRVLRGVA
jgi:hypothetical protein